MTHLLIFGDSIAHGAWDIKGGWAERLREFLHKRNVSDPDFYCLVYNVGVSGDKSTDVLNRFEFETKARMKEEEEAVFIFAVGMNDSQFLRNENCFRTRPEEFRRNIKKLIVLARKFSDKIYFLGLTPVDEKITTPIPWNINKTYKNEYVKKFNNIIKSVCKREKINFIEMFDKFMKMNYQELLEDGLHPNSKGHQIIFEVVKDYLVDNKII